MNISHSKNWSKILLLAALFLAVQSVHGAQKYGFSAGLKRCALWDTFFPISFQIPKMDTMRFHPVPVFNVIYIAGDNTQHMDNFYDLYKLGGINGPRVWPEKPYLANGKSLPKCRSDGECIESGKGSVGKGISAYDEILGAEDFKNDTKKVLSDGPYTGGDILWQFLPTRKLKLLRVEFFTPSRGTFISVSGPISDNGYVEPLFFEYRAIGNGDEMELKKVGGTAAGNNFNGVKLPNKIKLTSLSAIQVWLGGKGKDPNHLWEDLIPYAQVVSFDEKQMAQVPKNCQ
ncbi:hypothetical protein [Enterobacter cloacae]|uniref:hypothetical protein n=1 Tax=Enterobacter cloacae TaxID=550 RepID=UPI003DA1B1B9